MVLSTNAVEPMTRALIQAIEQFAEQNQIPIVTFEKGQRKDEVAAELRAQYPHREGVVFIGKAQEKCAVYRNRKTAQPQEKYHLCLDRQIHRPSEPLLFLLCR